MAAARRIAFDLEELEKLCAIQCTDEELAAWFGCCKDSIEKNKHSKKLYDYTVRDPKGNVIRTEVVTFGEVYQRGKLKGKASIRRSLFTIMQGGGAKAVTAAIFLAKNLLGYRDVQELHSEVTQHGDNIDERIERRLAQLGAGGQAPIHVAPNGKAGTTHTNGKLGHVADPGGPRLGQDEDGR